jgi:hypothetical protein
MIFFTLAVLGWLIAIPARWHELANPRITELTNLTALGWPVTPFAVYSMISELIFASVYLLVGLVIFIRRSDDRMAWFTSLMLVAFGVGNQSITPTISALRSYPYGDFIFACAGFTAWATFTQFPYLFPSGRYVPKWTIITGLIWLLLCIPWNFMVNTPLYPLNWPPILGYTLILSLWVSWLVSQVYRYVRISTPIERQQTKWVVYALAIVVANVLVLELIGFLIDPGSLEYMLSGGAPSPQLFAMSTFFRGLSLLAFLLLPLAFSFSIFRYRLWDIDVIIRKTLVYGVLSAILALLYFGLVTLLQALSASVFGLQSPVIIVLSTLVLAALFNPLRRRIQDFIDRRFYRKKYDAEKALAQFAEAARNETDLQCLNEALLEVVQETMQPERVTLWVKPTNRRIPAIK